MPRGAFSKIFTCIPKVGKEKACKGKELPAKFWKTTFSLATTWREEENAEGCRNFVQE